MLVHLESKHPRRDNKSTYRNNNSIISTSDNRGYICEYIENNPGVYLRKIVKDLRLPMGLVQYHLDILQREGLIRSVKLGMYKHHYSIAINDERLEVVLASLIHKTARDILVYLIEKPGATQRDIAKFKQVSAPTISWHMSRLTSVGIIITMREGKNIKFYIVDVGYLIDVLQNYYPEVWKSMASKLIELFVRVSSGSRKRTG